MKLLFENWRSYLKEIGDASATAFPFAAPKSMGRDYVFYKFSSPENEYEVIFELHTYPDFLGRGDDRQVWDISFETLPPKTPRVGRESGLGMSREGIPLKIMSTVVAIIKDFASRKESKASNKYKFTGVRKTGGGEVPGEESQRTKLYLAFLKRNMPDLEYRRIGQNEIHFTLPSKEQETPQAAQ